MKLIIAEKPVLGKCIAEAISGSARQEDGCIYKGDYVILWAYGHLLELKDPDDYDPSLKAWSLDTLPIYFENWGLKPIHDTKNSKEQRLEQIGKFLKQADCVIHAGDPDDEGQLLIDEILQWHNYTGPVLRLSTGDTTKAALEQALQDMQDNTSFIANGLAAHARRIADLLVGYNCSRYFTLKNPQTLLTVGRVQTSTLGMVVMRDTSIEGHQKVVYYTVLGKMSIDGKTVEIQYEPKKEDQNLTDGKILSRVYAEDRAEMLRFETIKNVVISYSKVNEEPPLPFNLTKLQSYCSSKFGYEPSQVLEITQSLRDVHKAITYNRSDCQYLSEKIYAECGDTMKQVLQNLNASEPAGLDMTLHSKCFDDSRVSAHTAIIPQNEVVDIGKMSEPERNVYFSICKYFIAQFLPPAVKGRTKLKASAPDGGALKATSTKLISPGYKVIFDNDETEEEEEGTSDLSSISPGAYTGEITDVFVKEKETRPPSRYTKASLCEDMTRISKYVKDPKIVEILKRKDSGKEGENGSIGTVATRAEIVDRLVEHGYLEEKGKKLISTELGRELYRILPDELKKPDLTAYWWAMQEDIMQGNMPWETLVHSVRDMVTRVVSTEYPSVDISKIPDRLRRKQGATREVLGNCPRCGNAIIEGKKGFGCLGFKSGCKFIIWKNPNSPMMANETIKASQVKTWLKEPWSEDAETGHKISGSSVHLKKLYSKTKDKFFEADVLLEDDATSQYGPNFKLQFRDVSDSVGDCPRCGSPVVEYAKSFSCSNRDCKFVIWKEPKAPMLKNTKFTRKDVIAFLAGNPVKKTTLLNKQGTKFSGKLVMEDDPTSQYGPNFSLSFSS